MCPLYPFHVIILYLCLLLPLLFAVIEGSEELAAALRFHPKKIEKLLQYNSTEIELSCENCDKFDTNKDWQVRISNQEQHEHIASIQVQHQENQQEVYLNLNDIDFNQNANNWTLMFNLTGKFLGFTEIRADLLNEAKESVLDKTMDVSVVRKKTIQSKLFSYSVAILVSLAYINMGCAMDLEVVKKTLKKPIGPTIGFICQYLLMPLISYGLGFIFGSGNTAMRLGLFVTGTSPGGGASNIWTVMFGGNIDLSVTMTAVSTFSAFFMMPIWIFTLGRTIFDEAAIVIPYYKICTYAFFLVVPLSIGLALARWAPKVSKFMVKILKPLALFLILFILIFGVWANLYIFDMMTWQVLLTGMGLPWLGFSFGFTMAKVLKRPMEDVIAIAIETGIQNTGMSIFILWFTLDHPLGDMTAVIPVAAATMTPLPLLAALIIMKIRDYCMQKTKIPLNDDDQDRHGDIIKPSKVLDVKDLNEFKESESRVKLVSGDANDNNIEAA